jgi:hypothetical protein
VAQISCAFLGSHDAEHADKEIADVVEGARARRAQDRREFREDEFDQTNRGS